jgi:hypothetical protein
MVLLAVIVVGYIMIRNIIIADKLDEYNKFAGLIAETSIAAELYRNNSDSFLVARDSILGQYELTLEDFNNFREKMQENQNDWRIVFDMASCMTDSLVDIQMLRLKAAHDSAADSSGTDSSGTDSSRIDSSDFGDS